VCGGWQNAGSGGVRAFWQCCRRRREVRRILAVRSDTPCVRKQALEEEMAGVGEHCAYCPKLSLHSR
jgi:hypothetical protein